MSSPFSVVTVCNRFPVEPYYCLPQFQKSLGDNSVVVLGTQPGEYTGLGSKPKLLHAAIKNRTIDTPYVIFTDCFDMVFQSDPSEAYKHFKLNHNHSDIIISSERNCFPADLKEAYDKLPTTSSLKYLNSGFIIGRTEAIYEALEAMDLPNVPDDYRNADGSMTHINDQLLWQEIFLKQPVKITLDTETRYSVPLHSLTLEDLDFTEELIRVKETGNAPFSLHMNGSAKTENGIRDGILNHLKLL